MRKLLTSFLLVQVMLIPCFLVVSDNPWVCCAPLRFTDDIPSLDDLENEVISLIKKLDWL